MKLLENFFLSIFCVFFLSTLAVEAQIGIVNADAETKPTLVILGSYHMGTPGKNIVNGKVDDVTAPERQKQIAELIEKLKKFKPTKIALEIDVEDEAKAQELYEKYLSGSYQLTKNETNQIGFRLAKELGHKKIYGIDWGVPDYSDSYNYEKFAAKDAELNEFLKKVYADLKQEVDAEHEKLLKMSVIEQLIFLNQPAQIERDNQRYFDFIRIGRGMDYVGANYVSWWYGRNMKIFANIIRITNSPNERILVIYGFGHLKLLTQFAEQSRFYNVESPLKYLKK